MEGVAKASLIVCVNVNAYAFKKLTLNYIIQHNLCSFTSINTCTKCIT